ncbi:Pycsar system effector family protein [uncultured Adlercreutzia sp.]|uniref:Pycsar system effector family protein n=1 Tax=uncultured Adlercreutzia sp. TaxID=875803 RepID=UPI002674DB04|nr:Pycsar system effector family protein [uncultured Adlercreutzia sp.]
MDTSDLKWVLDRTTEAVRCIDSKNGIITAVLAGIAAILFSNESFSQAVYDSFASMRALAMLAMVIASIATVLVVGSLLASIVPRSKCPSSSSIYAGKIAELGSADKYFDSLARNDYSLDDDIASQIYENSRIFERKTTWNRRATIALLFLIGALIIFSIFYAIGV